MNFLQLKEKLNAWQIPVNLDLTKNAVSPNWTIPTSLQHGILTSNISFILAKQLKQNPNQIAINLVPELQKYINSNGLKLEAKAIGAYINLTFKDDFWSEYLNQNDNNSNLIPQLLDRVIFDYIGANVAKRLHIGHMRNCNIGECLRRTLLLKYPNLLTDNHWGDWGVNMGVLIWGWKNFDHSSFEKENEEVELIDKLSQIYVWANSQKKIIQDGEILVRNEFYLLEQKDPENLKLWNEFITITKLDLRQDLQLLDVRPHDLDQGESFYEPDMDWLTFVLNKYSIWESDGKARYFDFEKLAENWRQKSKTNSNNQTNIPSQKEIDKVAKLGRAYLISSQGYTSYVYRDVAARLQWSRDLQASLMITITDKTQNHSFDQAFAIISYLSSLPEFAKELAVYLQDNNLTKDNNFLQSKEITDRLKFDNLIHIGYGFLKLPEGKMSSRTGNVILLRDLFEQVKQAATQVLIQKSNGNEILENSEIEDRANKITVAALKWNDLKQSCEQDVTFDIDQVLKFEGNTGVYQLYTFARLNSVLNKLQAKPTSTTNEAKWEIKDQEKAIIAQLYILPEVIDQVIAKYQPHLLTNYLYELSNLINKWYNDVPILKDDKRQQFLNIFIKTNLKTLEFGLDLLGIEVLESL